MFVSLLRPYRLFALLSIPVLVGAAPPEAPVLSEEQWSLVRQGEPVLLSDPDSKESRALAAILVPHSAESVWNVIDDNETATDWVEGLTKAQVTETGEDYALVYQEMKVPFLPGTFKYVIRHSQTIPQRRIDFERISGSFRELKGFWELHPSPDGSETLLFYQLEIDPGMMVPSMAVRNSLKKTLPEALLGLRAQVARVEAAQASAE